RSLRLSTQLKLIYSMDQHGISLHTVYNNMQDAVNGGKVSPKGFLIVVQSTEGDLFGAFISDILHPRAGYYGTGECFLWKLEPTSSPITPSTWTGKNDYFILSEVGFFAVGGGDGDFGLYLDSNLEHGHSASVPTFGNEVLTCTGGKEFMCCGFEVWGIGD
ncbi:TLDc domain-containing protein, partial [Paraphysoderma sedebokerense]